MTRWAVIPIKPLDDAKSRLADVLSAAQRRELVIALFAHTVKCLQETGKFEGIAVITADALVWELSRSLGIEVIEECAPSNLNLSLAKAMEWLKPRMVHSLMILPGDLPYLSSRLLADMVSEAEKINLMMVSPDQNLSGTNALHVTPKEGLAFEFGEDSFMRHVHLARRMNYNLKIYMSDQLKVDIDTPDDYRLHRSILDYHLARNPFREQVSAS